jgi:short subunit dehydrogenase-like uncharacterized protein
MMSGSDEETMTAIAVFGALGHTGGFVIRELVRRGLRPIAIARDETRLAGLRQLGVETRSATVDDPASLDHALAGAVAVINCAGPFVDTAEPVLAAALRARIHYLDVCAEQPVTQALFDRHAAAAREAGIVAIPAMGFYGGLGDLLATAAVGDWDRADDIRIAIALDSWHPTPGTRKAAQRNTERRLFIAAGALTPLPDPAPMAKWEFAAPFGLHDVMELPFTETILIARHLSVPVMHAYLNVRPLGDLRDQSVPPPVAVDSAGRSNQRFMVDVVASKGDEERHLCVQGQDIYACTAPLAVEALQRILDGAVTERGVLAPGAIFDAVSFLQSLAPHHLQFGARP